jgi:hypothetical protein
MLMLGFVPTHYARMFAPIQRHFFLKEAPLPWPQAALTRRLNTAMIDRLYDAESLQCSTCGLRFPPSATEQLQSHYDWHFRKNKVLPKVVCIFPLFFVLVCLF